MTQAFSSQLLVSFTEIKNAWEKAGVGTEEMNYYGHTEFNESTCVLDTARKIEA